jgi:hypothetical protein
VSPRVFLVTMGEKTAYGDSFTTDDVLGNVLGHDSHMFADVKVTELPAHAVKSMMPVHMPRKWWLRVLAVINAVDDAQPSVLHLRDAIKRDIDTDTDRVLEQLRDNLSGDSDQSQDSP